MKNYRLFILTMLFSLLNFYTNAQCNVTITPSATTVPCGGGTVTLTANGSGNATPVLDNDFDGGNAGAGWNVSPSGQFDNPCDPSVDGGTYMWMGNTTAAPRTLETVGLDVSCGGDICFYLDFSTQGDASPCEGPDLSTEGVYFEFSVDGGTTWNTIDYFEPNTSGCINSSNSGSGCDGNYTAWAQYCYTIPAGAETANTVFQWYQSGSSGSGNDHWGIDNVTINANGCGSPYYDWDNIPGTTAPTGDPATQTVNVISDTTFTVYYTDGAGFSCSETVSITVLGMGTPTVSTTSETCSGDNDGTATVTANGGSPNYTFTITSGPSLPAAQITSSTATFSGLSPGSYTVEVSDNGGCVVTNTFTIAAGPNCCTLTATSSSSNTQCNSANAPCDGSASVTASGGLGTITYQWYDGAGNAIAGETNPTINGLCAGTYSVDVTDQTPCTVTETVTITEPSAISFTSITVDATCGAPNGEINLSGTGGTGGLQYSVDGINFQTAGAFTNLASGTYTCYVQDVNGCQYSADVIVNSTGSVVLDSIVTTDLTCNASNDGTILVYTTGGVAPVNYSINGGAQQTSNSFTSLSGGNYNVEIIDGSGCVSSQTVLINEPAALSYSTSVINLTCFQSNDGSIEFLNSIGGDGNYQYSIDGGTSYQTSPSFTNLPSGTYNLQLIDGNSCLLSTTEIITEPTALSWVISTTDPSCYGSSDGWINVIPNGGTHLSGYTYNWTPSTIAASNSPIAQNLPSGNYQLNVVDDNGCQLDTSLLLNDPAQIVIDNVTITDELCQGDCQGEIVVSSSLAATFEISGPSGTFNNTTGSFSNLCSGNYTVTVYDANNCSNTQPEVVGSQSPINISISNDTTICVGGAAIVSASANGGVGALSYTWDNSLPTTASNVVSPNQSTVYSVFATDANGCVSSPASVLVSLHPSLSVLAFSDQAICPGEAASISAIGSGGNGGPYNYIWNQGVGVGATHTVSPSYTTTYTVSVTDGCETPSESADVTITVNSVPNPDFTVDTTDLCSPGEFTFTEVNTNANYSCLWEFGNGYISIDCGTVSYEYQQPGCYDVSLTVTSDSGCVNSITYPQLVCVHEYPEPGFEFGPQPTSFVSPEITFVNTSSSNSVSYYWTFGSQGVLGDTTSENPVFGFPNQGPGTYEVCLVATTQYNCADSVCQDVVIDDEFLIYVPNAFTPDGDGINDVFLPKLQGYDPLNYNLQIFDRWGELIFESQHQEMGWDGTYRNELCKTDVYVWQIKVKDAVSGKINNYKGHVSLLK